MLTISLHFVYDQLGCESRPARHNAKSNVLQERKQWEKAGRPKFIAPIHFFYYNFLNAFKTPEDLGRSRSDP